MNSTNVYFTLETLGKFYTDAAKTGGMHYWNRNCWAAISCGPSIGDCQSNYRPKPAPPIVRWVIQFDCGTTHSMVFETEKYANIFKERKSSTFLNAKIIKLVEEQS